MTLSLVPIRIGILGLGVVGSSFVELLSGNRNELIRRTGYDVIIRKIAVLDLNKPRKCLIEGISLTNNPYDVIQDPEIEIIIELIGGIDLPAQYIFAAISEGKNIITANKALIAKLGNKILSTAREKSIIVAFEAAVAGGLPIIKILREGLSGNKIKSIVGVLNGTCNFILTKMRDDGVTFNNALKEAQRLGYAEANPSDDVKGIDTAQKLAILASLAFGIPIKYEEIYTEGILHVSCLDLISAKEMGYVIKHLAYAERDGDNIHLRVHPTLILPTHQLAATDGVMNGIQIEANPVGHTFFYGAGAGGKATATAIIADLIDVIRSINMYPESKAAYLYPELKSLIERPLGLIENLMFSYYLRLHGNFNKNDIQAAANKYGIKIMSIERVEDLLGIDDVSTILTTDRVTERIMNCFVLDLQNQHASNNKVTKFRIHENEDQLRPKANIDLTNSKTEILALTETDLV